MADGRKRVDLTKLPGWAQVVIALATVLLVGGLALLVGGRTDGPAIPVSAIVAAVVAFAFIAWRSRHRD